MTAGGGDFLNGIPVFLFVPEMLYGSVHMDAVNDENLAHYYRLLKVKACLEENDLLTHPEQIYKLYG